MRDRGRAIPPGRGVDPHHQPRRRHAAGPRTGATAARRADADAIIGGEPAAYEITELEDGLTLDWWQLSPPGFPDRWIEVRALMRDTAVPGSSVLGEIEDMLGTVEFVDEP